MTQRSYPLESRSAQSRFFAYAQDTAWYLEFLTPVVSVLADLAPGSRVLDVGTGPGRLLAFLRQELSLDCVGVDVDPAMLLEARRRPELADVSLVHVALGEELPFAPHSFDAICFCSVLYLMGAGEGETLLQQARKLLRPQGRIVILTPWGAGSTGVARRHWTFYLWRRLTSSAGRDWQSQHMARNFAEKHGMAYACHSAFSNMATVEILTAR